MEVSQFTYFQQVCGYDCKPVTGELTYGLERLAMYVQGIDNVYDLNYNGLQNEKVTYGDVFKEAEREYSDYNFNHADTDLIVDQFNKIEKEYNRLADLNLALPAYDQCIKASHLFNLLDARGAISVTERQLHILRVRALAKKSADAWMNTRDFRVGAHMANFVLELLSEEIPSRMQKNAARHLENEFIQRISEIGLKHEKLDHFIHHED